MTMPMTSITGMARRMESGTDLIDQHGAPIAEPGLGERRAYLERGAPSRGLGGVDRDGFERDQVAEGDGAEGAEHEKARHGRS